MANTDQRIADNDQEITPLIENNRRSEDSLHVKIDIPTDVEELEPSPECCIYKVPTRMRDANEEAYNPQLISIGPLHHGNPKLARMERQKLRYYKKFSERTSDEMLEEFSSFIQENMKRICRCYDVDWMLKTESNSSDFIKMILLDSVFIIEFFLRSSKTDVSDFLFSKRWISQELAKDLVLLENQLPFFVLEELYNLAFSNSGETPFLHLVCSYFEIKEDETIREGGFKHFTDLARSSVVSIRPPNADQSIGHMYNARMLHEAGVKFQALHQDHEDYLLNVKFDNGVLQIPRFFVGPNTEHLFRNLMAFEQCHDPKNAYFCSYIQFLDYLIDTDNDVDILVKEGIISNGMGSSRAVADMINKLMVGVAELTLCYEKIGNDLNQHYDSNWNRTKATLKHVYFNNSFSFLRKCACII